MSSPGERGQLEIAHVLFIDIVGYSKLPINRQSDLLRQLSHIVRATEPFRSAETADKLTRLPTGDGMALAFFTSPDAPVRCAIEVGAAIKNDPQLKLRMGIHSGPVDTVSDVNDRSNVAGAGINMAQRVMDCGDAGHILLSKRVAEDLGQYEKWQPYLHELGVVEVKHGVRIEVVNFYTDEVGNPELPQKLQRARALPTPVDQSSAKSKYGRQLLIFGSFLLLTAALLAGWLAFRHFSSISTKTSPQSSARDKSIAVLPLENLSAEKENAFFADGIQDELLSNLAKIKDLKVISRTSVMQYKSGITRNLKEIAQQLGVSNVVEGSVRRSGNHVRVSVQLIDALTDRHIWAQNYDRTLADSLALQGELATEIAAGVGATLSPQEKARVEATPTKNTAAYDAYLRGRTFTTGIQSERSNVEGAIRSYQEAVKLDPGFVLAWIFLSCAQSREYWAGFDSTPARLGAAKEAVDRAVALDPNLPETDLALGYYRYYGLRDFPGALAEFERAEQGLPNNVDVLKAIALIQRRMGHWEESIAASRRAVELDPRNIDSAANLALAYMTVRRFPDAVAMTDHILAVEPSNKQAIWLKAICLWEMGNFETVDLLLTNPGTPVHLRAHQALNKRHYSEAADLFSKALKDAEGEEKGAILLDLGLAQQHAGDVAASKAAYQRGVQEVTRALSNVAADAAPAAELHSLLGVAYAGLGDAASAVSEGRKGMAMQPSSEDPFEGPLREEQMAQIYALLGDADDAIPILKRWIQISSVTSITPALMRIDPIWDPIRSDPRFQELVAEEK